jgi:hypothetical protein
VRSRSGSAILVSLIFALWLAIHLAFTVPEVRSSSPHYRFALRASPAELRRAHSDFGGQCEDFYAILMRCDELLEPGAELRIVLPAEPTYRYEYLRDRARYLLYPRNDGEDLTPRAHILVYGARDFQAPPGYERVESFAPHKYLLSRR